MSSTIESDNMPIIICFKSTTTDRTSPDLNKGEFRDACALAMHQRLPSICMSVQPFSDPMNYKQRCLISARHDDICDFEARHTSMQRCRGRITTANPF